MPALNHVSSDQMRLFIPARELREDFHPTDAGPVPHRDDSSETVTALQNNVKRSWRHKLAEAKSPTWNDDFYKGDMPTLYEDVAARGVQRPVFIGQGYLSNRRMIYDGHHRVAAAYANEPDTEVPVRYSTSEL